MERNILLCGFGAFGQQHAAAWRSVSPKSRLLLADTNPKARNFALEMGADSEKIENVENTLSASKHRSNSFNNNTTNNNNRSGGRRSRRRRRATGGRTG